jgi:hypothetical protein
VAAAARFEAALRAFSRSDAGGGKPGVFATHWKVWGAWAIAAILFGGALGFFAPGLWRKWTKRRELIRIHRSGGSAKEAGILYERMLEILARKGIRKPAWFTPVEFARTLPAEERRKFGEFTDLYNAVRFGGNLAATSELAALLRKLES